jgi:glutathione S-transferase
MFAAEKGMQLATQDVDLMAGENRQSEYVAKNPAGQLPCLQLDNGEYLSEVTAICEYLDEVGDGPSLIGDTAEARAMTRMWTRRIDLNIVEPMANGFRFSEGLQLFKDRLTVIPEAAEALKGIARDKLAWLNGLIQGRQFIAGEQISLADIHLYCFLTFGKAVGQPYDEKLTNLHEWYTRMSTRDSAKA